MGLLGGLLPSSILARLQFLLAIFPSITELRYYSAFPWVSSPISQFAMLLYSNRNYHQFGWFLPDIIGRAYTVFFSMNYL
jgi:hypothetical protein